MTFPLREKSLSPKMAGSRARSRPRACGAALGVTLLLGLALLPLVTSAQDESGEPSGNALPVEEVENGEELEDDYDAATSPPPQIPDQMKAPLIPAPNDLRVLSATQRSIRLGWRYDDFDLDAGDRVESFRIFYTHHDRFEDVKVIRPRLPLMGSQQEVELTDLEPYTIYEVKVRAVVQGGRTSPQSNVVAANTDVNQPGAPVILPLECGGTGTLQVKWKRPDKFDKSVDSYKLYFRPEDESLFSSLIVPAPQNEEILEHVLQDLDGGRKYVVKICAATRSVINPNETFAGPPSQEMELYLPEENCYLAAGRSVIEESFGMILGVVCVALFLILACIGFIVWR